MVLRTILSEIIVFACVLSLSFNSFAYVSENLQTDSPVMPYVMFALGENDSLVMNSGIAKIIGNICSYGSVCTNFIESEIDGNIESDCKRFAIETLDEQLKSEIQGEFNDNNLNSNFVDYSINDQLWINSFKIKADRVFANCTIITNSDFSIEANQFISENASYIYSQRDLEITSSEIDFTGVLYAPNGTIELTSHELNFSGIIIAKDIIINSDIINLSENIEVQNKIYDYSEKINEKNEEIDKEYEDTKIKMRILKEAGMEESDEFIQLKQKYQELHNYLQKEGILLNAEQISQCFNFNNGNDSSKINTCASDFYPFEILESKYDIKRKQSTTTYKNKRYEYYTLTVSDKGDNPSSELYLHKVYLDTLLIQGKISSQSQFEKFLKKSYSSIFGAAVSKITSCDFVGGIASAVIEKAAESAGLFYEGSNTYSTSNNNYTISSISVDTCLRYTWVYINGSWVYGYCCNYANFGYTDTFLYYNSTYKRTDRKVKAHSVSMNGDYFKPAYGVHVVVDRMSSSGELPNTGLYPISYNNVGDLTIIDSSGKTHRYSPDFYPIGTHLI